MNRSEQGTCYRFTFRRYVNLDDVADCLTLAVCAAEGRFGRARLKRDGGWILDRQRRRCTVDKSNEVGQDVAGLFNGFLLGAFGESAFQVRPQLDSQTRGAAR